MPIRLLPKRHSAYGKEPCAESPELVHVLKDDLQWVLCNILNWYHRRCFLQRWLILGSGAAVFLERLLLASRCCGMAQWTHGSRRPQPGTEGSAWVICSKAKVGGGGGGGEFSSTAPLIYKLAPTHLLFETIDESQPQGQIWCLFCRKSLCG